jgi:hypothetical protein
VSVQEFSDTVTVATGPGVLKGAVTAKPRDPTTPFPAVAAMLALPAEFAVTRPELLTLAIIWFVDAHVSVPVGTTLPDASLATTVTCDVCPTVRLVAGADSVKLATGPVVVPLTESVLLPLAVPLVALMDELPALIPVTAPDVFTEATVGFELE